MEWIEPLHGTTVALDTAPLIYFVEDHPVFGPIVEPFFRAVSAGEIHLVTSTVTLIEVLVHPLRAGDEALAHQYHDILLSGEHLDILPVAIGTAQRAAELRAAYALKTPDAIQVATALENGAARFLTGDRRLPTIAGLETIVLTDLAGR